MRTLRPLFTSGTAPDQVLFHDAQGNLLHEMAGADLLPLILFHDSGTFILRAPAALAGRAAASADGLENISPGDIVHVVHHNPEQTSQLTLLPAEVTGYETHNGVPMLSLRSLNGQSIEPGDSGSGIWADGRLAGNLWMTMREVHQEWWRLTGPVSSKTNKSLAAGLHSDLIDLVEELLQVETQPEMIERNGLS